MYVVYLCLLADVTNATNCIRDHKDSDVYIFRALKKTFRKLGISQMHKKKKKIKEVVLQ